MGRIVGRGWHDREAATTPILPPMRPIHPAFNAFPVAQSLYTCTLCLQLPNGIPKPKCHIVNLQCIYSHALANAYSVLTHTAERARWSTSERRPFYPAFGMPFPVPSCWASALFGTRIVAVCVDCARHGGHVCPACIMWLPYSNCQCRVCPAMVGGIS